MDLGAQRLQRLFVLDPEVLLLVDDHEAEVVELHLFRQHRVGADHDLDLALLQALAGLGRLGGGDQPRKPADPDRPAVEPLGEGREVLARQQRGRADDRDLAACHGHDEGGAERDLGLAEAHVAADQPVHGMTGCQIGEHVADRRKLVVGLLVGEAGAELVEQAGRRIDFLDGLQLPGGSDGDQALGHLAQAFLGPRFPRLPGRPAQPIELHALGVGAVAAEEVDVLDRQVEFQLLGVVDGQAVVRRVLNGQRLQAGVAADAVVDVDDEVAWGERRRLGDEVLRAAPAAGAGQAVAEDVGLGDDGQVRRLEP